MSYARTESALPDLHGVHISQGGIDKIMQRAGKKAIEQVKPIEKDIQQSTVTHCDETGSRVDGQTWWQWMFCSVTSVLHVIRLNRSADVIKDVMADNETEVWVSDCYSAQLKTPTKQRQLCLLFLPLYSSRCIPLQQTHHFIDSHSICISGNRVFQARSSNRKMQG